MEAALLVNYAYCKELEGMRLHLQDTEPALIPAVSESYEHRIQEIQSKICEYLLQQQTAQGRV